MVKFLFMNTSESTTAPAPPRMVGSLLAGFDAISNNVALILFPAVLDLFLWLGPRFKVDQLLLRLLDDLLALPGLSTSQDAALIQATQQFWQQAAAHINLFATLRSYPVGIASLMAGTQPLQSPLGLPVGWEVTSLLGVLGFWFVFNFLGLVIGTLYFSAVSQAALHNKVDWKLVIERWPRDTIQVVLLALVWALVLVGVTIPGSCMVSIISLGGLTVGQFALYMVGGLALWAFFPLLFSPHGIFVRRRVMMASVREGYRITRLTMPQTGLLFITILLINEGLGILWRVPEEASWLMLVGVFGHAFVATGLLAASFVYYREADRWVHRLYIQAQLSSSA